MLVLLLRGHAIKPYLLTFVPSTARTTVLACTSGLHVSWYNGHYVYYFMITVQLLGKYEDKVFDDRKLKFPLGEGSEHDVVEGVEMALRKMKKTQQTRIKIKPDYGFGDEGHKEFGIPAGASITYEVTLIDYVKVDIYLFDETV